ncbi:MAG TPA: PhoPQ-activated protein PqaA family protein, partial [Candidatus Marinimicrobia bacterium]|nr:PhoPQ-activated protein PqaA family protein [Candidatus Neomarinimicrobiota bacterium]
MIKIQKTILINIAILLSLLFAQSPALDNYIALEDTSYSYYAADTIFGDNYTKYILYLSSQTWRDTSEVDRTLWEHWVGIIVPDDMYFDKALFFIDGGSNTPDPPDDAIEELVMIATLTNSIVVEFGMVPNEPLTFSDETEPRSEDEIIAYTWDKYLNSGDETWILQLPMVKSAVRGMDMVQSYLGDLDD